MTNILIAGVGGQGTLLASKLIGGMALSKGFDVKVSEVHGMSQRGGSVVTYIRYNENTVSSPIFDLGEADVLMAFEQLEAFRNISYLKKGGLLLVNTQKINPMPVITGEKEYPSDILSRIESTGVNVVAIDALSIAKKAGSERAVNTVLIGVLAKKLNSSASEWEEILKNALPSRIAEVNLNAFRMGYEEVK